MNMKFIPAGKKLPDDIYVIIEISACANNIKYEIDKKTGILFVDRFLSTSMFYPCNYGYINNTLALDGDPLDTLVITPYPIQPNTVIRCRPVSMLKMIDDSGEDSKLIAVPYFTLTKKYDDIKNIDDLPKTLCASISHFFEHYKDLEKNKWTKVMKWVDVEIAKKEIMICFNRANKIINNDFIS
ncbi:MAG: inorganic diphosphatase [Candidatus Dasytiphilus stammeri]